MTTSALRIWFNRTYATGVHLLQQLRDNPDERAVRLYASHPDPDSPVLTGADVVIDEPDADADGYGVQVLEVCERHGIEVLWPTSQSIAVGAVADQLRTRGTLVISAPTSVLELCADKAATYAVAAAAGIPVPPHHVVRTGADLIAAYDDLAGGGDVCVKPTVGTGADGFRVLRPGRPELAEIFGPTQPVALLDDVVHALDQSGSVPLLVMPVLPGAEFSVDVLAADGRLHAALIRRKTDDRRRVDLVDDPDVTRIVVAVVAAVGLSMLANVQLRCDSSGRIWLLEVNARASGGLYQAASVGWNLPWAAIRLAQGRRPELPVPRLPAALVQVPTALRLDAAPRQAPEDGMMGVPRRRAPVQRVPAQTRGMTT
jgi:biotin carboxylase